MTMVIAHRTPIDLEPTAALTWTNLLGSCDGGQRAGAAARTCDAAQGNTRLTIDPTSPAHIARVRYERRDGADGLFIGADDEPLSSDLQATLNLNGGYLPASREQAWRGFQQRARKRFGGGGVYGSPAWKALMLEDLSASGSKLPEWFGLYEAMAQRAK
jgi:hypothetical protein